MFVLFMVRIWKVVRKISLFVFFYDELESSLQFDVFSCTLFMQD
jgi:hypothetical protein